MEEAASYEKAKFVAIEGYICNLNDDRENLLEGLKENPKCFDLGYQQKQYDLFFKNESFQGKKPSFFTKKFLFLHFWLI